MTTRRGRRAAIIMTVIALTACLGVLSGCESDEVKSAKEALNGEIQRVESQLATLQDEITTAEELASTEDIPLDESVIPALENEISNAKAIEFTAPSTSSSLEEINEATAELKELDYTASIQALQDAETAVNNSIEQMKLVTNPTEAYVIQRLREVEGVSDIAAATEDNDPNGQLNKDGGYTAAVFFSSPLVNESEVSGGPSVIDKGTDGGGCIEVYKTAEDAEKRNTYLSAFDGGILASGSHTVVGTVVIRTSSKLTASQQDQLEAAIIESLTKLS